MWPVCSHFVSVLVAGGDLFDKPIARMRVHVFDCVTTGTLSPFPTRRTGKGEQEYNQSLPDYQRLLYVQDARKLLDQHD